MTGHVTDAAAFIAKLSTPFDGFTCPRHRPTQDVARIDERVVRGADCALEQLVSAFRLRHSTRLVENQPLHVFEIDRRRFGPFRVGDGRFTVQLF